SWMDQKLRWNPQSFDGIKQMMIPINRIWYPDIIIDNMIEIQQLIPDDKNYAIIDHSGSVQTSHDQLVSIQCKFKMASFPFDVQNCSIHFASWMFTADRIDMVAATTTDYDFYQENAEWRLISLNSRRITVMNGLAQTPYVDIHYDIVIQRNPARYLTALVFPCFVIVTLGIVAVFSPMSSYSGDRRQTLMIPLLVMFFIVTLILATDQKHPSFDSNSLL
uniref:Neurotransmitter-gated ion-channel ligand-binding domain-containing protein n=1 Tax=Plectus sambesii TaxID=2011161 RepID=A0A914V0Q5_9BILA